ncbi:MAG TPA: hypothetical protein VGF59_11165 [Bryobacteraceae bacterium]
MKRSGAEYRWGVNTVASTTIATPGPAQAKEIVLVSKFIPGLERAFIRFPHIIAHLDGD